MTRSSENDDTTKLVWKDPKQHVREFHRIFYFALY